MICRVVARVVSLHGSGTYQKAGLMIRETLASGSTEADITQWGATAIQLL
jgi:hypothetical protein